MPLCAMSCGVSAKGDLALQVDEFATALNETVHGSLSAYGIGLIRAPEVAAREHWLSACC